MTTTHLVFVHALSPLHAGTGQGSGVIDMPIAREKATNLPYLPGSSLKGPLRDRYSQPNDDTPEGKSAKAKAEKLFGKPESDGDNGYAGSVQFSDMRLLLLPVRSLYGTFAWVTSPYILNRFARDVADVYGNAPAAPLNNNQLMDEKQGPNKCIVSEKSALHNSGKVYLEDLDHVSNLLDQQTHNVATVWGEWLGERLFSSGHNDEHWREMLTNRLCVVHDDVFSFLLTTATEITARIRLNSEKKTVERGALWYEESLPAESVLSGLMLVAPTKASELAPKDAVANLKTLSEKAIQLGGKATVGRGMCRITISEGAA